MVLFFLLMVDLASAQGRFYTLVSEQELSGTQTFQVQYVLEGADSGSKIGLPTFHSFLVLDKFETHSSSFDPRSRHLVSVHSCIVVLSPRKAGRFIIPGATAVLGRRTLRSNAVKIVVRPAGGVSSAPGREDNAAGVPIEENSELRPGESITEKIRKNLFLRVEVNKKTCYVGECLLVTYKAYTRLNTSSQVMKRPSFNGFSVLEMVDTYDSRPTIEKFRGLYYYVNLIRKVQLIPLQAGVFQLDPAEVESVVHFMSLDGAADSSANSLQKLLQPRVYAGSRKPFNYQATLATDPISIEVKSLPGTHQPDSFKGAVGRYAIQLESDKRDVNVGEPIDIRVIIKGTGNLQLLGAPDVKWPPGVDTSEPRVSEEINKYSYPLQGSKTFAYTFVAPDTGIYTIPPIDLSYFDPVSEEYHVTQSQSLELKVSAPSRKIKKEEKENTDIRTGDSSGKTKQFAWFAVLVAGVLAWISYQAVLLIRQKHKPEPVHAKEEIMEKREAATLLQKAAAAMDNNNRVVFYEELQAACWRVISDITRLAPSELNKAMAGKLLAQKGVPAEAISEVWILLDQCEQALYVPGYDAGNADKIYAKAEEILELLLPYAIDGYEV